ncbi:Sporulation lipoprotein YhcN/YlaJ (Spore_YhcN_YlaJ) [Lentibacillus persicus]|uniref:Sporulation lipoprotein YhcN/YlaJ (Spore_YhcN_YlaJ) n=1 Tax=Lentibacillus persicus TaxID=640948 RepID=A0A1I1SJC3_9BACI|nr:YhcN/YlaJ family sporulation lipoprotein [Lentibacillus persicus]SFD46589.1 Sporulation lipoprotein YhcN/YlaJ (Spore_YhcN_YlaJ) [Lentibacillus persicus]
MGVLRFFVILALSMMLVGCGTDNNAVDTNEDIDYSMISSSSNSLDQSSANQAKEKLKKYEDITKIHAVSHSKKLLVAFEIKHHKRFQLAELNKKVQKKLDKEFPDLKVEVSTDKKLVLELKTLEEKIENQDISAKKLKKEVNRLIKLKKDKT